MPSKSARLRAPESVRLTTTVEGASEMLGISRAHAYKMASTGELPTVKLGGRTLVPLKALERMLEVEPPPAAAQGRR